MSPRNSLSHLKHIPAVNIGNALFPRSAFDSFKDNHLYLLSKHSSKESQYGLWDTIQYNFLFSSRSAILPRPILLET